MKNLLIISALLLAQFSLGQIVNIPNANFKNGHLIVNWIRYIKSDAEIDAKSGVGQPMPEIEDFKKTF